MATPIAFAATQSAPDTSRIVVAASVAEIVIAVVVVVLSGLAILTLLRAYRLLKEVQRTASNHLGPVIDRSRVIADNLEFITQVLRQDVEKLGASVETLTDRLHLASDRMEERIEEFNALMEVVQGEAEEMFLDTASTVRGVREGARAMSDRAHQRPDRRRTTSTGEGSGASTPSAERDDDTKRSGSPGGDGGPVG